METKIILKIQKTPYRRKRLQKRQKPVIKDSKKTVIKDTKKNLLSVAH